MNSGEIDYFGLVFAVALLAIGLHGVVKNRTSTLLMLSFTFLIGLGISQGLRSLNTPMPSFVPAQRWLLLGSLLLGIAGGIREQRLGRRATL